MSYFLWFLMLGTATFLSAKIQYEYEENWYYMVCFIFGGIFGLLIKFILSFIK
jgi:hypothetical protein